LALVPVGLLNRVSYFRRKIFWMKFLGFTPSLPPEAETVSGALGCSGTYLKEVFNTGTS